ncbi:hypothetical protein F4801DRAFT_526582, partial [Xylaria longipes]
MKQPMMGAPGVVVVPRCCLTCILLPYCWGPGECILRTVLDRSAPLCADEELDHGTRLPEIALSPASTYAGENLQPGSVMVRVYLPVP